MPEQILDLKVCDPAMGSGAFLVEACRALAARLVQAWGQHPEKKPKNIPPDEDEELHAKRLVAQRCLYGVDKNPLATDLAKLSLWLATLARDHEFTFLDHALKSGDSLVGLTQAQIAAAHWDTSKSGLPLFRRLVKDRVDEAMKGRAEIQAASDDTARAIQEARHGSLEVRLKEIRLMADAVIAAFFAEDKPRLREKKRAEIESWLGGSPVAWGKLIAMAGVLKDGEHPLAPFHWEIEFPEVFARDDSGFDAVVGNPPFAGKNTTIDSNRENFPSWLKVLHIGSHGNADLVSHFFRRAFDLLRQEGCFGLIATNTIGQGDTRATGLAAILGAGGTICRAIKRVPWPGEAAVVVSVVHVVKGSARYALLNNRKVSRISAYLVEGDMDSAPERLSANAKQAFQGSILLGVGFTFDNTAAEKGECESIGHMRSLIRKDRRNADRIRPLIGGDEVTSNPRHQFERYAIDFFDMPLGRRSKLKSWSKMTEREAAKCRNTGLVPADYTGEVAEDYPDLLKILRSRVKPIRDDQTRPALRDRWWQYAEKRPGLYRAIAELQRVFVNSSKATPHHAIASLKAGMIYTQNLNVFAFCEFSKFTVVASRIHEVWARFAGTTMKDDFTYAVDDCFGSFPFPLSYEVSPELETAGDAYHNHRAALMVARNEGMTKIYNRFHDPAETAGDIQRLRELHAAMDRAVLQAYVSSARSEEDAYKWLDFVARAEPIFLDETNEDDHTYQGRLFWPSDFRDEVLACLLELNAERHAEEVRLGIAPGIKGKAEMDDEKED